MIQLKRISAKKMLEISVIENVKIYLVKMIQFKKMELKRCLVENICKKQFSVTELEGENHVSVNEMSDKYVV